MTTRRENARAYGILVADQMRAYGSVYRWGGQDLQDGLDCSGFVVEWLREVMEKFPEIYDGQDRSAQDLFIYFVARGSGGLAPGSLICYGDPAHHIAIHICSLPGGTNYAIESGGAGSGATSDAAALGRSAGIRFTDSFKHGSASWVAVDPFLLVEG